MFLMQQQQTQQQLLIFLIYQQFLCHGTWAIRTQPTTITNTTVAPNLTPTTSSVAVATPFIVSSSEATLLTTHFLFQKHSQQQSAQQPKQQQQQQQQQKAPKVLNNLNVAEDKLNEIPTSADTSSETEAATETETDIDSSETDTLDNHSTPTRNRVKTRYKILAIHTNCTRDMFELSMELNRDFHGLLYAKDFPWECRTRGTAQPNITLRVPTSGCGVRAEPRPDGTMELSVRVMLQMEQKLRQSSDILKTVRCKLPLTAMGMTVIGPIVSGKEGANKLRSFYRHGRMRSFTKDGRKKPTRKYPLHSTVQPEDQEQQQNSGSQEIFENYDSDTETTHQPSQATTTSAPTAASTASRPRVRVWLELGGPDGSGAVEVGQATTLTVRAIVPGTMGVRIVDCAALDGLGESTQQLLDERGCPIDEQVMPALHTLFKPAEEGWSKLQDDDLVEKMFTATFPAFKFPDRERLHVSCGVQLCKGRCPNINCHTEEKLVLAGDKHLARIEVFNSLAVTAPQIEVDRLRYDRRYNNQSDDYFSNLRPLPADGTLCLSVSKLAISFCVLGLIFLIAVIVAITSLIRSRRRVSAGHLCTLRSNGNGNRIHRSEVCTSMFSSSSESAQSARFGSKLFMPYYPNTLPYGRVY